MEEGLQSPLNQDVLTGISNRFHFIQFLEKTINKAEADDQSFILAYLDIDNFDAINSTYGQEIGDILLKHLARNLTNWIQNPEYIARINNDDFVLLIKKLPNQPINQRVQELLKLVHHPILINNQSFNLTASLGLSLYPTQGTIPSELIKNASIALADAKLLGGSDYQVFNTEMDRSEGINLAFEAELSAALKNNEFFLHYQPILDVKTEKIVGIEALLRWNHPHRGIIYPDVFLPNTESTGLILPIGEWVLFNACQQVKQWHDQGARLFLAVNFSPRQFEYRGLYQFILQTLRLTGLDANFLQMEITESLTTYHLKKHLEQIKALRYRGIDLAIDNFGTDYTSFNHLKKHAFSVLKIDKTMIYNCTQNTSKQHLVSTIIQRAKKYDLKVSAEGVENREQFMFLRDEGCDFIQGFYFSEPLSPPELESKWLPSRTTVR